MLVLLALETALETLLEAGFNYLKVVHGFIDFHSIVKNGSRSMVIFIHLSLTRRSKIVSVGPLFIKLVLLLTPDILFSILLDLIVTFVLIARYSSPK